MEIATLFLVRLAISLVAYRDSLAHSLEVVIGFLPTGIGCIVEVFSPCLSQGHGLISQLHGPFLRKSDLMLLLHLINSGLLLLHDFR